MSSTKPTGVPSIPMNALASVKDENTRIVLQAIVDGWQVRNAASGNGANAFVTRADLTSVTGARQSDGSLGIWPTFADYAKNFVGGATPGAVVADIEASLLESPLFQQLGASVSLLNQNVTAEQLARIAAVQAVADDLSAEVQERLNFANTVGGQILSLQNASDYDAEQISLLGVWRDGAQNAIANLSSASSTQAQTLTQLTTRIGTAESAITSLNTTTGDQAQTLASLSTRVGNAESDISTLNTTTANQASTLSTLSTTIGNKANTYFQATAPTGTIATGSLWFDSDDNNKPYRWDGAGWQDVYSPTSLAGVMAAITNEATTRASEDNAISTNLSAQIATLGSNLASLSTKNTTLTNSYSSLANTVTTLQTTVGTVQTAVQVEAEARADLEGAVMSRYGVKIDTNGYVSGYGLLSTTNTATPTSQFIVRADNFAIGSPSGPGITPRIPFSVLTTADAKGNQPGVYMDMAVIKAASITGAYIADLAVDTLKIADNAVTLPDYAQSYISGNITASTWTASYLLVWEDTGLPLTQADMDKLRSNLDGGAAPAGAFTANPEVNVFNAYNKVFASLPPRDYRGQPVMVMFSVDMKVTQATSTIISIARIEEDGNLRYQPDAFYTVKIPRSWWTKSISYYGDFGGLKTTTDTKNSKVMGHEVAVVNTGSYTFSAFFGSTIITKSSFTKDVPPTGKRWQYVVVVSASAEGPTYVSEGTARCAAIGLMK